MAIALMIGIGMASQALMMAITCIVFGVINIKKSKTILGIFLILFGVVCFAVFVVCAMFSWAIIDGFILN